MASNAVGRIPPLFSDLAKIIAGEIDCSHATLDTYSTDNSPYCILPQAIMYPKNVNDIKHLLSFAREYTIPVTPCGNGGSNNGGALSEGVIVDLTRYFSQIKNVNILENTITVEAGVTIEDLLEKLHAWNYDIPLISMSNKDTTVGALVATKSASGSSFHHGTIREWIEGLTVVVDTGEEHYISDGISPSGRLLGIYQEVFPLLSEEHGVLRAAKPTSHDDASGYSLWSTSIGPRQLIDQLVGSEGTFGIITSVTFRISPYKPHRITTCIPVMDKKFIAPYIEIAKHHKGEHMFLYDQMFMQLAEKYHPMLVPFFIDTPYVLLVTHSERDLGKLNHIVRTFRHAIPVEGYFIKTIDDTAIIDRITDTKFLTMLSNLYTNTTLTPVSIADGLIVTIHQIPQFLEQLEKYLDSLGKLYIITGNIGSGHISVTTLFDSRAKEYDTDIFSYTKNIFSILKRHKGGISAIGGEGIARAPFLSYVYSDQALAIFKKIKNVWDPLSILNPGKKIGTTTNYLQQHLKHSYRAHADE